MNMVLTFQEFRNLKDKLPDGSMRKIATDLHLDVETVRNYFGGANYRKGKVSGVHFEKGTNGGFVRIDNEEIYNCAMKILQETEN